MSVKFFLVKDTALKLPSGQSVLMGADGYMDFVDANTVQDVVETLAGSPENYALNSANFPDQTDVDGTSYNCTYQAQGQLVVGTAVDDTPVLEDTPAFTTTTIEAVFNVALDDSITNVAGLIVYADGVLQDVDSISITTVTLSVVCHTSMAGKDVTLEYVPSAGGTLISDDGALVGWIPQIVVPED